MSHPVFPFSAIVGQQDMKLALQMAAVDPSISGVGPAAGKQYRCASC